MLKQRISALVVSTVILAGAGTYVAAQAKPAAPSKAPAPTSAPAQACQCPACTAEGNADHGNMGHGGAEHAGMHCPMQAEGGCPMMSASTLADVKVEQTANGATITLTAKDAANVKTVQNLAHEMAHHLSEGHAHGEHGTHSH